MSAPFHRHAAYEDFISAKVAQAPDAGFDPPLPISEDLFPFQRDVVRWALKKGCAAIFLAFGLGKTRVQIEIGRQVCAKTGGRFLIVAPLGVRQEFARDAAAMGIEIKFIRRLDEAGETGLYLTNYETVRDGKLDPRAFDGASLDEASCLRQFGASKTFREFMATFAGDDRRDMGARIKGEAVRYRFVATATPGPNEVIEILAYAAFLGVMDISTAKAQPLDAKVLTAAGWRTMGSLAVGDEVIAVDGTPTRILGVYPQGERPIFKITFSDGSSTECDAEHLWLTRTHGERNNERRYTQRNGVSAARVGTFGTVRTTAEIAATIEAGALGKNHTIPLVSAVQFAPRSATVDPWLLGALIGDANLRETSITFSTGDDWMLEEMRLHLPEGMQITRRTPDGCDYGLSTTGRQGGNGPGSNPLLNALREYGLLGKRAWEKRIPEDYLFNTPEVRLALLRGLMDTDGSLDNGSRATFTTTSEGLAADVTALVRSLGGVVRSTRKPTHYTKESGERVPGRDAFVLYVSLPGGLNPFSLPRKASRYQPRAASSLTRYVVSVEPAGTKPAQCIGIEHPSRLYVTDDFIVTHNTRFFERDSEHADCLTLHPHKVQEFWQWVASWAVFVSRPSDLGYADDGYALPELRVHWHEIPTDHRARAGAEKPKKGRKSAQMKLLADAAAGLQEASREAKASVDDRVAKLMEIRAANPGRHRIVWHDREDERDALERAIPTAKSVYGSQEMDEREAVIAGFADGHIAELLAKPVMLGSGCNFQRHCAEAVFLGVSYKFNDFIQAVHRIYRFLQTNAVDIHIILTEAQREIRKTLEEKWAQHNELVAQMTGIIRQFGLAGTGAIESLRDKVTCERREVRGDRYTLVNNDCVDEIRAIDTGTIGLYLTSIPFSTQYKYSASYRDFGHTDTNDHFFAQMDYLTPEVVRVLKPGRMAVVHVKDRNVPGGMNGLGFQTVYPFHADCIRHYQQHGLAYMGMITIVTDVVRENAQTYRLGWTEQCKDGTKQGVGMPEYLLIFRKPPTSNENASADEPVVKSKTTYTRGRWQVDAHGFHRSNGNRFLTAADLEGLDAAEVFQLFKRHSLENLYDYAQHVALCDALDAKGHLPPGFMLLQPQSWHPDVWTDVARMRTMNTLQAAQDRVQHLCPMQFDVAKRCIERFSMPGETVLDTFMGLGTVPYCAVELGRVGHGIELSEVYFNESVRYLRALERKMSVPTLFDLDAFGGVTAGGDAE